MRNNKFCTTTSQLQALFNYAENSRKAKLEFTAISESLDAPCGTRFFPFLMRLQFVSITLSG